MAGGIEAFVVTIYIKIPLCVKFLKLSEWSTPSSHAPIPINYSVRTDLQKFFVVNEADNTPMWCVSNEAAAGDFQRALLATECNIPGLPETCSLLLAILQGRRIALLAGNSRCSFEARIFQNFINYLTLSSGRSTVKKL